MLQPIVMLCPKYPDSSIWSDSWCNDNCIPRSNVEAFVTGFQNVSEDNNFNQGERSLKQSLHQLQHLSNVWKGVLPDSIYNKAMGKCKQKHIEKIL